MASDRDALRKKLGKLREDIRFAPAEGGCEVDEARTAAYDFIERHGAALDDALAAASPPQGEVDSRAAPSPEHPHYMMVPQNDSGATKLFMVVVDEGWRQSILCEDMYGLGAAWLVETLQGKPFAPETAK